MDPVLDDAQREAAERLAALGGRLGRRWHRPRGIYLHGRPGRGKTMLMDRFFAEARSDRKRRYHFHEFFARLHAAVAESGSIDRAVDAVLGTAELVCFDEFHVHDIGDAMLIARLLDAIFARRVVLVVTSNYPPVDLLPNPLFHDRFLPAIERLREHLDVVAVDGPRDYRVGGDRRSGLASGCYIVGDLAVEPNARIPVAHTNLRVQEIENRGMAVDFAELCGAPLSAADFLELAGRYRHWTICGVPALRTVPMDWATRFVNLVDVLYDADLPLTVHASTALPDLTRGVPHVPDLARAASRLSELPAGDPTAA
ncbi:cell division protein ZapE [Nocardia transvalensis]|uniref:Cell division protein ZapE n=1 Tax=Nocardia transvalensis TaxID=37333 RepID=A0A7W9PCR0_9NOCA|nr:cell division protein ZapE [Nocardia transvalensis]MBB5913288.1 cell division protein ZapE [Nocardia transvalensis]